MDFRYPYTDMHELNLDWFLARFKEYYEHITEQDQKITTLEETVEQFTNFVTNYFDNLDVQVEINNKLDAMAASGELQAMLQPYFDDFVEDVNTQISGQNNRITTLEGRMDGFTNLPEGSTTGDAELADIRVGYAGNSYPNAGDAVRGQVGEIHSMLDDVLKYKSVSVSNNNFGLYFRRINTGETYEIYNNTTANISFKSQTLNSVDVENFGTIAAGTKKNITITQDAYRFYGYGSGTGTVTATKTNTQIAIINKALVPLNALNNSFTIKPTFTSGYIDVDGSIHAASTYNENYTNMMGCIPGQTFDVSVTLPAANGIWIGIAYYNKAGVFLSRDSINPGYVASHTEHVTIPAYAYSFNVSFRIYSYTTDVLSIVGTNWAYFATNATLPKRDIHLENSAFKKSIRGINHTGYYTGPENTLPAFKLSKENGFSMVECDVRFTSDNVPVLCHDASINRTARNADGTEIDTTVNIASSTYNDLLQYDFGIWKGAQFAGTKIPTLEEFIVLCRNLDLHAYIELKGNWDSTLAGIAYNIVKKYNMQSRVSWISTAVSYLKLMRNRDNRARLGYVVNDIDATIISDLSNLILTENHVFIDCIYTALTDAKIDLAIAAGLPVETYTINSAATMKALNTYIDGVTSDTTNFETVFLP